MRLILSILLFICLNSITQAQSLFSWEMAYNDRYAPQSEAILAPQGTDSSVHSPKQATIYSAILPGLGQFYNRKYWKIGLIYGGGVTMGVFLKRNLDSLSAYQRAVDYRLDTLASTVDTRYPSLSEAKVIQERNYYRRNRDMLILGFVGLYALQVIDANVDAHLREFEINDDLSLSVDPDIGYSFTRGSWNSQLRLSIHF